MIRKLKSYFSQLIRGHLVIWPRSRPRPCTARPAPLLLSAAYYYYYSLLTWIFRGRIGEGETAVSSLSSEAESDCSQ